MAVLLGKDVALEWIQAQPRCSISVITWIEVLVGCGPGESEAVEVWLRGFHCLQLDGAVAREAVDCRRALGLKVPDAIILATARCHQLRLATRNIRDFPEELAGVVVPYTL
ncbi:type II toxin-antitoxin system VapC family toxin [Cyanobium sp. AMD-g]|nr:type II toxin-antitoxin system VapC family toxin [Cyanobium sp. AMD-g]